MIFAILIRISQINLDLKNIFHRTTFKMLKIFKELKLQSLPKIIRSSKWDLLSFIVFEQSNYLYPFLVTI
jgi:hypothetical protein